MKSVQTEALVQASLAEVWDLYFERRSWASWVDEFRGTDDVQNDYPAEGGTLVWHSGPSGRGQVTETVLEHEPRRIHRIRYLDQNSEGEQTTTFEIKGEGTKVTIRLDYALLKPVFVPFTDRLFVQPQMRAMLTRTMDGLQAEASELSAAS